MSSDNPLRKAPQQTRSQQRVETILKAAETLLLEVGYEGLTTSDLAKRAGVSVGSLYQFFSNKDAVMQALGERYLAALASLQAEMFSPDSIYIPTDLLIGRTIDLMVRHETEHPAAKFVLDAAWGSFEMQQASLEMHQRILQSVEMVLDAKAPDLPADVRRRRAEMLVYMIKGIITAIMSAPAEQREAFVVEGKRAALAYAQLALADDG